MNVSDFTYLLQHPEKVVSPVQTNQLDDILDEFPYFQAARAIQLKGLKNLNSFKYNSALKVTAAYTADRDILFDFITSKEFLQNTIADSISGKSVSLKEQDIEFETIVSDEKKEPLLEEIEDKALPQSIKDAEQILDPALFSSKDPEIDKEIAEVKKEADRKIQLGEPLPFTKKEKYSFKEWMQLAAKKPIQREDPPIKQKNKVQKIDNLVKEEDVLKKKKFNLIDKFIETNPKIVPKERDIPLVAIEESTKIDKNELMTQTLAKVYLEQKKFKKAIQAYKILSLKYPEKSSFFASQIKLVQQIQKENK